MLLADAAEERLHLRQRPEVRDARRTGRVEIESPPAKDPPLDQIGVDIRGLLDREVTLVDRPLELRAKLELLFQGGAREELDRALVRLVVERRIDPRVLEDGEADLFQRTDELLGKVKPVPGIAPKVPADVAGPHPIVQVERLVAIVLGQVVLVALVDLVVADVVLVGGVDAFVLPSHGGLPFKPV